MHATALRRAAALLLALALLAAAAPAVAAPDRGPREEASLVQALAAWIAELLPGAAPGGTPVSVRAAQSPEDGRAGATRSAGDDPTAEPQLGPGIDPNG